MESAALFLILATAIALFSMELNYRITKSKIRADQAFWLAWVFLIWSAETVTAFPYFEYYHRYPVQPETRELTLLTFIAAAIGFSLGSILYSRAKGATPNIRLEQKIVSFANKWQLWVAVAIFIVGLIEFSLNRSRFSNLLDLRHAALEGEVTTSRFYTQFFLFSQAFIMLIGFTDGFKGKVSRVAMALSIAGLILHNLSVGGRIAIIVGPLLYIIPFILRASTLENWDSKIKSQVRRISILLVVAVMVLFSVIQLLRSYYFDTESIMTIDGFLTSILFAIPMYVSDTFISISTHASHARNSDMPMGYFTFDAFYRLLGSSLPFNFQDGNVVFGHAYYRDTPDPWAWTQTNLIPRLISDFGSFFWLALVPISAVVQWLSLYKMRISFLNITIRSLMIFSSAYTILAASWFTALNVYIIFYSFIIYFLAKGVSFQRRRTEPISELRRGER